MERDEVVRRLEAIRQRVRDHLAEGTAAPLPDDVPGQSHPEIDQSDEWIRAVYRIKAGGLTRRSRVSHTSTRRQIGKST